MSARDLAIPGVRRAAERREREARRAIEVEIPGLRLLSEANTCEHWRTRAKRTRAHVAAAWAATVAAVRGQPSGETPAWLLAPLRVTIVRVGPRALDSDNLVGSAKHVRDGIAKALRVDDGDPRVEWVVEGQRGAPRGYAVRVRIEGRA